MQVFAKLLFKNSRKRLFCRAEKKQRRMKTQPKLPTPRKETMWGFENWFPPFGEIAGFQSTLCQVCVRPKREKPT